MLPGWGDGMLPDWSLDDWPSFSGVVGHLTKIWRVDNVELLTIEFTNPRRWFACFRVDAMSSELKRKSGENPVRSRHCNWRDALQWGLTVNPRFQPLSALSGWEGGGASLSAISQEACQRV